MMDTGKRYHIIDMSGNYYRLNEKNNLVSFERARKKL